MKPVLSPRPSCVQWKMLYRAAILEKNKSRICERVSEAESAILARGRELFYSDATPEERDALEDALYALRALRSACDHADGSEAA